MGKKLFTLCSIMTLFAMVLGGMSITPKATTAQARSVDDLAMFQKKFDAHYRVPNEAAVQYLLQEEGVLLPGASQGDIQTSVQKFISDFVSRNPDTPNPRKLEQLLNREQIYASTGKLPEAPEAVMQSLVVPVEFTGTDTLTDCDGNELTFTGPLHNEVPPPGPRDNNTIWYDDTTPELYNELYFGEGPDAGVIVHHPNLGAVDLRGNTMANYYLEQSGGMFKPEGEIYPAWVQSAHSQAYFGQDGCTGGSHNIRAKELVLEVVDQVKANTPDFAWQKFDADGDGFVDNFTVIHAGVGQESGGGTLGDWAIWSHASAVNWPDGYLACEKGSAGCPDRDISVLSYSMDPEQIDIGVIAEEYGHAAFGLPDIYTTDYQLSVSNWAIMEAGSWNGPLGGMEPAPFPLWFRILVGWAAPVTIPYGADPQMVVVGQLSQTPDGLPQGIRMNLPPKEVTVPNPLGTGKAAWSNLGDQIEHTLAKKFDLSTATAPIFSFESYWSIEQDWDYGYVEVSTDDGATWTILQDMDGIFTDTSPNQQNQGWGLTGEGMGTLRFDLAAYAGQPNVWVQLRYWTDAAVQWQGWWADDVRLADGETVLFTDDFEAGLEGWTTGGWTMTPFSQFYNRYYLAEWRNASGFDKGLAYPYLTVYYDDDEWEVDRTPYTVPGMLLYFRDTSYALDYTLGDSWYDPPSWGPKHGLIVVDSHYWPLTWDTYPYATGAHRRLNDRVQPGNATFTLQPTTPFTARLGFNPLTGQYLDEPLETKYFAPLPGVDQFHDSLGYYPGFYYPGGSSLYWWNIATSAVVPAKGDYTTRITDVDMNPFYGLYGLDMGGTILGSGNPGDDDVQLGINLQVLMKAGDGSWGAIAAWNSPQVVDLTLKVDKTEAGPATILRYDLMVTNKTPVPQHFVLDDPVPANTVFLGGTHYNAATNSIHWEANLTPGQTRRAAFFVMVGYGVPSGTEITNTAQVWDAAIGDTETVVTKVK